MICLVSAFAPLEDLFATSSLLARQLQTVSAACAASRIWFEDDHSKVLAGKSRELSVTVTQARFASNARKAFEAAEEAAEEAGTPPAAKRQRTATAALTKHRKLVYRWSDVLQQALREVLVAPVGVAKHATGMWLDGTFQPWANPDDVTDKCLTRFHYGPWLPVGTCSLADELATLQALACTEFDVAALAAHLAGGVKATYDPTLEEAVVFAVDTVTKQDLLACVGYLRVVVQAEGAAGFLSVTSQVSCGTFVQWSARIPVEFSLLPLRVTAWFRDTQVAQGTCRPQFSMQRGFCCPVGSTRVTRPWREWPVRFQAGAALYAADPARRTVRVLYPEEDAPETFTDTLVMPVQRGGRLGDMTVVCGGGELLLQWQVSISRGQPCGRPTAARFEVVDDVPNVGDSAAGSPASQWTVVSEDE